MGKSLHDDLDFYLDDEKPAKNYVKVKLGKGSVTFKDFSATEFNIGNSNWQFDGKTLTKQ